MNQSESVTVPGMVLPTSPKNQARFGKELGCEAGVQGKARFLVPRASISGAKADGNPFLNAQVSAKRAQKLLEEKKLQQYGSTDGVCSEQG